LAAEHLSALTFGQVNNKSMMGTVQLSDAEADRIISSGIAGRVARTGKRYLEYEIAFEV
jgi:hypothetical protein